MDLIWRLELLGRLRAQRGGTVITRFRTRQAGALLARLALFPRRAHAREELIDLLWPDADLEAGRNRLRVALASLRRQLEPPGVSVGGVLIADRAHVRLNPEAVRCDAVEFEAALAWAARAPSPETVREACERAAHLYGGELLPGFYDDWVQDERERLAALYDDLCERLPNGARARLSPAPGPLPIPADPTPVLHGVPLPLSRFFGREGECARLAGLLDDPAVRLVTLSGPGGAGKTRLATEAAREARRGPVFWVGLADLGDARLLPAAVAAALGLTLSREPLDQVAEALACGPPALLVLDNLEHLVEQGAPLVQALLMRVPTLTILVTSRRRLALPGERELPIPPLALPLPGGTAEQIAASDSARLFVDRAQAARPDFQVTVRNAADLAALCRDLEGLPLALELAAARAGALSLAEMRERLAQRFAWLASRRTDKNARHRSLWAALAWSFDLLAPPLQRFFASLSVFRGGCTVEAAVAVCEEAQALELLTQLRERSLALVEEGASGVRFRLLESVREFAGEQLSPLERERLRARHAGYFARLADDSRSTLRGPEQARWRERLDADHDNLRAALDGARDAPPDDLGELRTATALSQFWAARGHLTEGLARLEEALARRPDAPDDLRGDALHGLGYLAYWRGDYAAIQRYGEAALPLRRALGDPARLIKSLQMLGVAAQRRGEYARAESAFAEGLAVARQSGGEVGPPMQSLAILAHLQGDDERSRALHTQVIRLHEERGEYRELSLALYNTAEFERSCGYLAEAESYLERSLALCREHGTGFAALVQIALGNVAVDRARYTQARPLLEDGLRAARETAEDGDAAVALQGLGRLARLLGDLAPARRHLTDSLMIFHRQGDTRQVGYTLEQFAALEVVAGRPVQAARLMGATQALWEALGVTPTPAQRAEQERQWAAVRAALGMDMGETPPEHRASSWKTEVTAILTADARH